jgi:hypothetical protein
VACSSSLISSGARLRGQRSANTGSPLSIATTTQCCSSDWTTRFRCG